MYALSYCCLTDLAAAASACIAAACAAAAAAAAAVYGWVAAEAPAEPLEVAAAGPCWQQLLLLLLLSHLEHFGASIEQQLVGVACCTLGIAAALAADHVAAEAQEAPAGSRSSSSRFAGRGTHSWHNCYLSSSSYTVHQQLMETQGYPVLRFVLPHEHIVSSTASAAAAAGTDGDEGMSVVQEHSP
jgi:hypothetical protein